MKRLKYFSIILFSLFAFACQEEDKVTLHENQITASELKGINEMYVLDKSAPNSVMETLMWTVAKSEIPTPFTYELEADLAGKNFANPVSLGGAKSDSTSNDKSVVVITKSFNEELNKLYLLYHASDQGFDPKNIGDLEVEFRVVARIGLNTGTRKVSNIVKSTITAYYVDKNLKPYTEVAVKPYFIIGLANGAWNNSVAGLGVSIYPLGVVEGNEYNSDGAGKFVFTGYINASSGFKLIRDIANWDEQWGQKDGAYVHNDGGSGNITVAEDGYYTITLNSIEQTLKIEKATITPTVQPNMGMVGDINGWGATPDIALSASEAANNHVWYTTYTFANASGDMKFRANSDWGINWGECAFPVGISKFNAGNNTKYTGGTYVIIFNDITGATYFFKQ